MSFPETFYTVDILFLIGVVLFGVVGLIRGFSGELARILSLSFLLLSFCFFYPPLTQMAVQKWDVIPAGLIQVVVALIFFFAGMAVFLLLRVLFKRILKEVFSWLADKVIGTLSGLVFGMLVGLSVMSLLTMVPSENLYRVLSEKSMVGGWVCESLTPWLHPRLMELPMFDEEEN